MSLKGRLFKPRWAHRKPEVRAVAVAQDRTPELLRALPRILLEDEDQAVRMAAARRCESLAALLEAHAKGPARAERELLEARLRVVAGRVDEGRPDLDLRMEALKRLEDRDFVERLARMAPEAELRLAALERVQRQGLLGDIAIEDADAAVRRAAAGRIRQASTMQRVIDETRKTDKALHQELLARQHAERLAAGDPAAIEVEALEIIVALEAMPPPDVATRRELDVRWSGLDAVTPRLAERYRKAVDRLDQPSASPRPGSRAQDAPGPGPETDASPAPRQGGIATGNAENKPPAPERPAESAQVDDREEQRRSFAEMIDRLRERLDAGQFKEALALRKDLQATLNALGKDREARALAGRLARLQGRLRELRDWQRWANNKIRKRLIRDMAALPGAGLHPDALLVRLKELQGEWKALEQSEQIPGDRHSSAPIALWKAFQEAGNQAFELARPFLDKRTEVRAQHLETFKKALAELETACAATPPDFAALQKLRNALSAQLRELNSLPAGARKKLAAQARRTLDAANEKLQGHFETVELAKRGLIRRASQLPHLDDEAEAIEQAKQLQSEWQQAGRLWRSRDQALWQEFRSHIDPLFGARKAASEAERAERDAEIAAQAELVRALQAFAKIAPSELLDARGRISGLQEAWDEIAHPDRAQQQAWESASRRIEQLIRDARRAEMNLERERARANSALLHRLELAIVEGQSGSDAWAALGADWAEPERSQGVDAALDERRQRLVAWPAGETPAATLREEQRERARAICIRLEFLAGLPSPESERDLRMRYQVERLSSTLSGEGARLSAHREALECENEWLCLEWLDTREHAAFQARIIAALKELEKQK